MELYFLTSNQNKLREAQEILGSNIEIINKSVELDEIQSIKVDEVIKHKIEQAKLKLQNEKFFVEDTAVYLGEQEEVGVLIKYLNNDRVVKAYKDESAKAVCAIGLSNGQIFKGTINGTIVKPRGENGFGWDAIFQPEGFDKTFGEMTAEEKNKLSMRKFALEELKKYLSLR